MQIHHPKKANLLSEISAVAQLKSWSEGTETQSAQLSIPKYLSSVKDPSRDKLPGKWDWTISWSGSVCVYLKAQLIFWPKIPLNQEEWLLPCNYKEMGTGVVCSGVWETLVSISWELDNDSSSIGLSQEEEEVGCESLGKSAGKGGGEVTVLFILDMYKCSK